MDDGMFLLREEIKTFNPHLTLMENPRWLPSESNRQFKLHGSILVSLESAEMAEQALKHKLHIAGNVVKAEKYVTTRAQMQCQNCQVFSHSTRDCRKESKCQICAGDHVTRRHAVTAKEYPYFVAKCSNCEDYTADSKECEVWKVV
jgi:DnaJ-class molecular chaperone